MMKTIGIFLKAVSLLLLLGFVSGCNDDKQNNRENEFTKEQAQIYFSELKNTIQLVNFDRMDVPAMKGQDVGLSDVQPLWASAKKIETGGKTVWEIPVVEKYKYIIVAGKRNGNYIRPSKQAVDYRLLISKNELTGELVCRMLTLVGYNMEKTNIDCLENLLGYVVISDVNGEPEKAYVVKNGELKEIKAGNKELEKQETDFYCFCFWKEIREKVLTKVSGEDTSGWVEESFCLLCLQPLEYCTCNRCPDCGNTVEYCVCSFCHICGEPHSQCGCREVCSGCGKLKWQCDCATPPVPALPYCPACNTYHDGECTWGNPSEPSPGSSCKYGNVYCPGGDDCRCCPKCGHTPCNCLPFPTEF